MLTHPSMVLADNTRSTGQIGADAIIGRRGRDPIKYATLLEDAFRLAESIPQRSQVANYCVDRYHFLACFMAAIIRRQVTLLPNDKSRHTLQSLAAQYPSLYCVADTPMPDEIVDVHHIDLAATEGRTSRIFPTIENELIVAQVFTSGTTGQPVGHAKTWGSLETSGRLIVRAFGLDTEDPPTIVSTVPAQHMYGLETTIMVPIVSEASAYSGVPLFPADVVDALNACPEPRILVTTPIHIRALVRERAAVPKLRSIISATDNLPAELAAQAEDLFSTPVREIFGCTEAGSIASRRTIDGEAWRLFDGLSLTSGDGPGVLQGQHLSGPVRLSDFIELRSSREFIVRGRVTDLIKVGGKRASLSGLNASLAEIDGVLDGAFYWPPEGEGPGNSRPIVLAVAPERSASEILSQLRPRIDPAFLPRRVLLVPSLPRNSTGKLSAEALQQCAENATRARAS